MLKEEMSPEMERMCDSFEVSCVGCPLCCGDSCNIKKITKEEAIKRTSDWYDGNNWSSVYKDVKLNINTTTDIFGNVTVREEDCPLGKTECNTVTSSCEHFNGCNKSGTRGRCVQC